MGNLGVADDDAVFVAVRHIYQYQRRFPPMPTTHAQGMF
jgi:hypothetical protein